MSLPASRVSVIRAAALLLVVALVPALLSAWLHPRKPEWQRTGDVSLATTAAWTDVLWVDARSPETFAKGHIPDAKNLTPAAWESLVESIVEVWKPGMRVVVYCDGHGCEASHEVAARLKAELGLENVHVLTGGWDAWRAQHPEVSR